MTSGVTQEEAADGLQIWVSALLNIKGNSTGITYTKISEHRTAAIYTHSP